MTTQPARLLFSEGFENGTATKQPWNQDGHALVVEHLSGRDHSSLQFFPAHHAKGVVETVHHLLSQKSEHGGFSKHRGLQ